MASETSYQLPLMQKFQENFEERINQKRYEQPQPAAGENLVAQRRRGLDESGLKRSIAENISRIVNTVDLQSSLDVSKYSHVRKSILNFGLYDIHSLTSEGEKAMLIEQNVVAALICYEPRIVKDTVRVERQEHFDDVSQRLQLSVKADIRCKPVDLEIELTAEIDLSGGKVHILKNISIS